MNPLVIAILAVFAVASALTIVRMVIGPSILDRAVASDVLLTMVLCVLGAEAVINQHTRTLPVMLIIAAIGVFGSIAVARFVARKERDR
ncbi:monovalent cation/H+ antiporter complex subunit F [Microbacterium betulae]|uniref:Monovalent cation/H+ antiporter complex subunit F n=1 Tax=Microbacterium betulae TaxID=2981139 RepID=A0AA97FIZ1_9MICO|nr:monovalent cation/H+ antiporter complex subunit F [Microbacterium sp. AB]WOF23135.1 monovalent cation/H+ antiporter complex subunit F [Microbacterium sp. AB]